MRHVASLFVLLGLAAALDAAAPKLVATLQGHTNTVTGLAFYPDGKALASCSRDGTVRLWDVTTGKETRTLLKTDRHFRALALAPDGSALAAASGYGEVTLLRRDEKAVTLLDYGGSTAEAVAFSPDSKVLAVGWGRVSLFDVASHQRLALLDEAAPGPKLLAFSPDGRSLIIQKSWQTFGLWDVSRPLVLGNVRLGYPPEKLPALSSATVRRSRDVELPPGSAIFALACAPNGRSVAVCRRDPRNGDVFELWDLLSGKAKRLPGSADNQCVSLAFSPNGRLLAGARWSRGEVTLWDLASGKEYRTLTMKGRVTSLAFSADGKFLALGDDDGALQGWQLPEEYVGLALFGQTEWLDAGSGLRCLALRPDGKEVALGSDEGSVTICESGKETPRLRLKGHTKTVLALAYSPDGKALVSAGLDGTPRLWDAATGKARAALTGGKGPVLCVAFAPDGKSIATGDSGGTVRLWDADGKERRGLQGHKGAVRGLAFTPDGKALVSGGSDGLLNQWDLAAGGEPKVRLKANGPIMALALTRDGKALFLADGDGMVTRLDRGDGQTRRILDRPVEMLQAFAVSPDGKTLAMSSRLDEALRLYDVDSGKELAALEGHSDWVSAAAFSADGRLLVTASMDGTARLWRVAEIGKQGAN